MNLFFITILFLITLSVHVGYVLNGPTRLRLYGPNLYAKRQQITNGNIQKRPIGGLKKKKFSDAADNYLEHDVLDCIADVDKEIQLCKNFLSSAEVDDLMTKTHRKSLLDDIANAQSYFKNLSNMDLTKEHVIIKDEFIQIPSSHVCMIVKVECVYIAKLAE
jgi:hypothetical protein